MRIGGMRRTMLRGLDPAGRSVTLRAGACDLARLPKLLSTAA